jgi:hypothetical protein
LRLRASRRVCVATARTCSGPKPASRAAKRRRQASPRCAASSVSRPLASSPRPGARFPSGSRRAVAAEVPQQQADLQPEAVGAHVDGGQRAAGRWAVARNPCGDATRPTFLHSRLRAPSSGVHRDPTGDRQPGPRPSGLHPPRLRAHLVGSGFAAAVLPVTGADADQDRQRRPGRGEVTIPVGDFKMPAYRAAPAGKPQARRWCW